MSEQVEKIKALIKIAKNPKPKAMYEEVLAKLESESNQQPESQPKPQAIKKLSPPIPGKFPPQINPNSRVVICAVSKIRTYTMPSSTID
jgi:hypothetical protein